MDGTTASGRLEIGDEFLLQELLQTLCRVCDTFPSMKPKTCSFIESAFVVSQETQQTIVALMD
jgi:hypothetical protein